MRRARPYRAREVLFRFDRSTLGDLDAALTREWLETNGLGGFASSTIVGLNTRRYHGLLDAKIGDWVVTPRHGKPVEIEAPWYNALRSVEGLAKEYGDTTAARHIQKVAAGARRSFGRLFWNGEAGCLYDVIRGVERDGAIRPNQIIAVGLPFMMLTKDQARRVVDVVERDLLTPYGLRTLAPGDPRYQGRYEGDAAIRDAGYHQGAAWPWLMGAFVRAYLKVNHRSAPARRQAEAWLRPLHEHLREAGLGQISELFDGDPPHTPRGCIAQAWSVAELLRATNP